MLDSRKVAQALAAKKALFGNYHGEHRRALADAHQTWRAAMALSRAELEARLQHIPWPGARPTAEHGRTPDGIFRFPERWQNHEEARDWAQRVLLGVTTLAVDGSQIAPAREFSIPIGAVQVGWFENPHDPARPYTKDISFEVLAPQELAGEGEGDFPDAEVNWRRFQGECERLSAWMRAHRGQEPKPVCFFDGSLIVSFAQHMQPGRQQAHVRAVMDLLAASAESRVPLVGYVDTSYAADLTAMLAALDGRAAAGGLSDGALLRPLMHWGDRTAAWLCAREDGVQPPAGVPKYYDQVALLYLKTTAGNAPARLDLPRWVLEEGELERVVDIVRAECVVGNGYPYGAETADAVAVISAQDRERFYAAFQRFAEQEGLPLHFSRKAGSKLGRR